MNTARARKVRIAIEAVLTTLSAVALVLTLVMPDWIERLTGESPDGGSGETEWLFTAVACVVTLLFAALTAWEWRRLRAAV
ncbi:hypothetical protein [Amycolatopsis jejuensis]|uniref:hypothetical protein n=1 Tax=Amycolatopsis jejuensis TaxID=330084 RepID=UPI000525BE9D|nr:hypothetical protein [Amycolatopsis jejuensis]